ncbi:MAG: 16S rRNA (guanine(527)-N(7))-methyltransferase RsmG [Dermatophilaceae bacterium]
MSLLAGTGTAHGLIGPRERQRLWERHILNCAALAPGFDPDSDVVDIGSGAGLPGIPLAIARPDLRLTLVEPLQRRGRWLEQAIRDLQVCNVSLVVGRAESLWGQVRSRYVTARAVARLGTLAAWSLPLLQPRGSLLVIKGASAQAEMEADRQDIVRLGGRRMRVERYGQGLVDPLTIAVRIEVDGAVQPPGAGVPRRQR